MSFSGKVYFCPFIRVEVGDLAESSLEEIWNGERYVEMRRRLVENGIFPGLPPLLQGRAVPDAGRRAVRRRRAAPGTARDSADRGPLSSIRCSAARTLLINPPLINGVAFTRQGRCQEREDVLGTTKPPYTLALLAALLRDAGLRRAADRRDRRAAVDRRRHRAARSRAASSRR